MISAMSYTNKVLSITEFDIPMKVYEVWQINDDGSYLFDSQRGNDKFIGTFLNENNAEQYCREHSGCTISSITDFFHPEYNFMDRDQYQIV